MNSDLKLYNKVLDSILWESVVLSENGSVVAFKTYKNHENKAPLSGIIICQYYKCKNEWFQLGEAIGLLDIQSDCSIYLSNDGYTIAIRNNNTNGTEDVMFYRFENDDWALLDCNINNKVKYNLLDLELYVSNNNRNTVVIGSPYNDGIGNYSGHARIYKFSNENLHSNYNEAHHIDLSPTSEANQVHIKLENNLEFKQLKVYNILGQLLKTQASSLLDLFILVKGLYRIEILTNRGEISKKLQIE